MRTIEITQRNGEIHEVLIDDDAPEEILSKKWGVLEVHKGIFYACRRKSKKEKEYLHRAIIGDIPKGLTVDHINRNTLDNRKENLRIATYSQNNSNRGPQKRNKCGLKGVTFHAHAKKWIARIVKDHKIINIGLFKTPEEAHAAYCKKGKEIHGEFFNPG